MFQGRTLHELLRYAVSNRASDLHLAEGTPPSIRVDNNLSLISDVPFTHQEMMAVLRQHLSEERIREFQEQKELDYSFGIEGLGRFRANLFYQRSHVACAIRDLPSDPMSFEAIGFPRRTAEGILEAPSGLVLVTGPTGSGKTTTLATMIDAINETQACHIVTIEDPIEFLFKNKKSVIHQREVGSDTATFHNALKHVLRQDPDVILIGEMRDLETIEIALTVAETGHLVFATLHTPDAAQSINRIIDVFPAHQQQQVRVQLSFVLQAVISQQLIEKIGGGRTLASEILIATPAVRNLIRESKSHQIYSAIQTGQKEGMRTLNMGLAELVKTGKIAREAALSRSSDTQELERLLTTR
ncbi:MAG: type IV pilus twitching motility protein PilT [Candidatus Omnitrophica bacterium]|nr:type IV pilus twitching motility protein PilT [Candidatus Omnitrophota bacterium]